MYSFGFSSVEFQCKPINIGNKEFTPNIEQSTELIKNKNDVRIEREVEDTLPEELI